MLTLIIFLLTVYGLANAIAMLKIGCYFFGDPTDELVLENGTRIPWKRLLDKGESLEIEDCKGRKFEFKKLDVGRVLRRKGLGRIPYLGDMFYCPACLSFWIGGAFSMLVMSPSIEIVLARGGGPWTASVVDGLAACAVSSLLHAAYTKMLHGIEDA
jgi:hypothetical protein